MNQKSTYRNNVINSPGSYGITVWTNKPDHFSLAWVYGNQMTNTWAAGALLYYILDTDFTLMTNGSNQMFNGVSSGDDGAGEVKDFYGN